MSAWKMLTMALLMALVLAGCGGSAGSTATTTATMEPAAAPAATASAPPASPTSGLRWHVASTATTEPLGNAPDESAGRPTATAEVPSASVTPEARTATAEPGAGTGEAQPPRIEMRRLLDTGGGMTRLALNPQDGRLYYMDMQATIYRVDEQDGTARATQVYTLAEIGGAETQSGGGLAFGPDGTLYVVSNEVSEDFLSARGIVRKGVPDGGGGRTWSTLASSEPYPRSHETPFNHAFNAIVVSPDGAFVYVNSGSRTDHGEVEDNKGRTPGLREVPLTSAIFRIPAAGQDLTLPADEAALLASGYLFADGFRNAYDLAFSAQGELFGVDNGPDSDYPDELNYIQEGRHYGFPWRLGALDNPQQFPGYDPEADPLLDDEFFAVQSGTYHDDPDFPKPLKPMLDPIPNLGPDADQYRAANGAVVEASDAGGALATFTGHRCPLGLVFDTEGALPGSLKGDALVLSFGAAGGSFGDQGQDLLHVELEPGGDGYSARVTRLKSGFHNPVDSVQRDGVLYVLDFGGDGTLWEVSFQ